jgi:hypothetical protein
VRASKPRVTAKTAKICLSSALSSGKLFYQKLLHEEKKRKRRVLVALGGHRQKMLGGGLPINDRHNMFGQWVLEVLSWTDR